MHRLHTRDVNQWQVSNSQCGELQCNLPADCTHPDHSDDHPEQAFIELKVAFLLVECGDSIIQGTPVRVSDAEPSRTELIAFTRQVFVKVAAGSDRSSRNGSPGDAAVHFGGHA